MKRNTKQLKVEATKVITRLQSEQCIVQKVILAGKTSIGENKIGPQFSMRTWVQQSGRNTAGVQLTNKRLIRNKTAALSLIAISEVAARDQKGSLEWVDRNKA